ncbi:hypothetical protein LSCM1_05101 [Leishmania martiniquensis]|uniref:Protein kinase domain-containing protein n=1 Tax=Leishmania martiniquensis TaxID=1580590 RepID=A0A836KKM5_9TRYP|nr:hypothetical protein LSCM1_05101 [Leishmania martiniquensis]
MSGGGGPAKAIGNGGGVVGACDQCGTAFHKASARFCSRCGTRRDVPTAAARATRAATSWPNEPVVPTPPLASAAATESVFTRPGGGGARDTLRPFDVEQLSEEKRKRVGNGALLPPLTGASPFALQLFGPSGATTTTPERRVSPALAMRSLPPSEVGASSHLPEESQQQASSIEAKGGKLPEVKPGPMADPGQGVQVLTSSLEGDAAMRRATGNSADQNRVPISASEQPPTSPFPLTTALVGEDGRRTAAMDGSHLLDASKEATHTTSPEGEQAPTTDEGDTKDAIAPLRPSAEEEAQYTAWATLSPDDLTPEMLQTANTGELRQWHKGSLIGRGTYGSVYLGLLPDGSFHAVKCVELGNKKTATDHLGALELVSLSREINMMRRLRHPNLCTFKGAYYDSESASICMFMEYIGGGSLSALVKKFKPLPPSVVRCWTQQLLAGLHYLHSQNIIHRDIKGDNVLVDTTVDPAAKSQIKLVDFGAARRLTDAVSQSSTVIGTPYWMAPEVVDASGSGSGYSYKADVWSVGCTVAEMLTGRPPWPCKTNAPAAIMMIASASGMPTEIPEEEATPGCLDFMRQCFIRDPEKRPTVQQLLQHPWIQVKMP